MTLPEFVPCALWVAGSSWFVALWHAAHVGRGDLVYRLWSLWAGWFAVSAAALVHVPDHRLGPLVAVLVAVSLGLSFVVDELIERRW